MTKPKVAKKGWRVGKKKDESAAGAAARRRNELTKEKERNAPVTHEDP